MRTLKSGAARRLFVRLRFGLGAWSNRHFEHTLYPMRTLHAEYLPRYATVFDCAEADVLHHRAADAGTLEDWVSQTPPGFTFLPKMHKEATHGKQVLEDDRLPPDAKAAERALQELAPLERAGKLGPILLQFPPSMDRAAGWDHLLSLLALRPPGTFAVEFRDPSWFVPAVRELLEDFEAPLVWSTHPKAFAPPWATAGIGYMRFTGTKANTRGRHITVADRLGDILEIRKRLAEVRAAWKECFVIVTNPFEGNAVDSLPRIAAALGERELAERLTRKPGSPLLPDEMRAAPKSRRT